MYFLKRTAMVAVLMFGGVLLTLPAQAAVVNYNFDIDHCTGGCGTGSTLFGTATVTDVGSDLNIHIAMNQNLIDTGLHTFAFAMTQTGLTVQINTSNFAPASGSPPYHQDGFGNFGYAIECTIHLPGTCGTVLDLTVLNANTSMLGLSTGGNPNVFMSGDIISTITGNTGPVGTTIVQHDTPPPGGVPEPPVAGVLGMAMVGLGFTQWRRQRRRKNGGSVDNDRNFEDAA